MENRIQPDVQLVSPLIQTPPVAPSKSARWPKIVLLTIVGLTIAMSSMLVGIQIGKGQTPIQQPITSSTGIVTNPTASPTAQPAVSLTVDPTENWKTYKSEQYKFEFRYPADGKLEVSQTGYVRIQNYISNDLPMLKSGEYYLEFNLPPNSSTCKNLIVESKTTNQLDGVIYKGLGQEGGDAGGTRFALCAERPSMNLYLQVTENNQSGIIANQILSTFKLTD